MCKIGYIYFQSVPQEFIQKEVRLMVDKSKAETEGVNLNKLNFFKGKQHKLRTQVKRNRQKTSQVNRKDSKVKTSLH